MTPKEKAEELIEKFADKDCALFCVNQILLNYLGLHKPEYCKFDAIGKRKFEVDQPEYSDWMTGYDMERYWQKVKAIIENL